MKQHTARWTVTLSLEVPATEADYDNNLGINHLVWLMRRALQKKTGVWFEYESSERVVLDAEGSPVARPTARTETSDRRAGPPKDGGERA